MLMLKRGFLYDGKSKITLAFSHERIRIRLAGSVVHSPTIVGAFIDRVEKIKIQDEVYIGIYDEESFLIVEGRLEKLDRYVAQYLGDSDDIDSEELPGL